MGGRGTYAVITTTFLASPTADGMDGLFPGQTRDQTTFSSPSIRVLLQHGAAKQRGHLPYAQGTRFLFHFGQECSPDAPSLASLLHANPCDIHPAFGYGAQHEPYRALVVERDEPASVPDINGDRPTPGVMIEPFGQILGDLEDCMAIARPQRSDRQHTLFIRVPLRPLLQADRSGGGGSEPAAGPASASPPAMNLG